MAYEVETIVSAYDGGSIYAASVEASDDGAIFVAGTPTRDGGGGVSSGKVYVCEGADWATQTGLVASDGAAGDQLGTSVACSDDGSVVVAGAPEEDGGGSNRGKVYVYSGASWATETMLTASDAADDDYFGFSVACSADGSVIVVGAPREDGAGAQQGKVYVYSGVGWGTETIITPASRQNDSLFGAAVACSDDGSVIVVGAPQYSLTFSSAEGQVYVFSGASWATETGLMASDASAGDQFGYAVACSDDASVITAGAPFRDEGAFGSVGKAYVLTGASWGTETMLEPPTDDTNDRYGLAVASSADGATVAAGSIGYDGKGEVFVRLGASWATEIGVVPASYGAGSLFGRAVAFSDDATILGVGAETTTLRIFSPAQFVPQIYRRL